MARVGHLGPGGSEGRSLQLQRRLDLVKYLVHQVRSSRTAYYPDGCGGGLSEGATTEPSGESAAAIAASGAEGLADSLDPAVRVSDLLDALLCTDGGSGATAPPRGAVPTWGDLARDACHASRQAQDGLELYLCERLLPLLDDAIAALCEYIEKLQADENQFLLQQSGGQQGKRPHGQVRDGLSRQHESQSPRLLLGQGLRQRFDPLVWLGQYLLRQGKAAEAFKKAQELCTGGDSGLAASSSQPRVRGEHIRLAELPLYEALAAEVRDERGWRAFEALRSPTQLLFERVREGIQQEAQAEQDQQGQEQHDQQQQEQPTQLLADNLPLVLQAIDSAWGLQENHGFLAAVAGADVGGEEDSCSPRPSIDSPSDRLSLPVQARNGPHCEAPGAESSGILGACSGVSLEVADPTDVKFSELWRFLASCLEACPPLKRDVFAYALRVTANNCSAEQADSICYNNSSTGALVGGDEDQTGTSEREASRPG